MEIQPFCGVSIIAITYTQPMPHTIPGGGTSRGTE
jgi:hypothetical protein